MNRLPALLLLLAISGCGRCNPTPTEEKSVRPKVEKSTGWTFASDPQYVRVTRAEVRERLERDLQGPEGERVEAYGRALQALQLLPKGYSLREGMKKAWADEMLAYYDLKERKIFLIRETFERDLTDDEKKLRGEGGLLDRDFTLAHELVHALQDQQSPAIRLLTENDPDADDVCWAIRGFIEGQATIHTYDLGGTRPVNIAPLLEKLSQFAAGQLPNEPPILRYFLYSPYVAGGKHILARLTGEIAGSGPALLAILPLSTEQLWFPDRMANDPPVAVFIPDLSKSIGGGRALTFEGVLGMVEVDWLISSTRTPRLGPSPGGASGSQWEGDRIQLYEKAGAEPVVVVLTHWDTAKAALGFHSSARGLSSRGPITVAWSVKDVAIVAGLPEVEGRRVAYEALDRRVAKPFRSIDEMRSHRRSLAFPAAGPDLETRIAELAAELESSKGVQDLWAQGDPRGLRLLHLAQARVNAKVGVKDLKSLDSSLESLDWTAEEIASLAVGGVIPRRESKHWKTLLEAYDRSGEKWPDPIPRILVESVSHDDETFAAFVENHLRRPGIAPAALRYLGGKISARRAGPILKAITEGLISPTEGYQGLEKDPKMRGPALLACLTAWGSGKSTWPTSDGYLTRILEYAAPIECPPGVLARSKDLSKEARTVLAVRALNGPEKDDARKYLLDQTPSSPPSGKVREDSVAMRELLKVALDAKSAKLVEALLALDATCTPEVSQMLLDRLPSLPFTGGTRGRVVWGIVREPKNGAKGVEALRNDLEAGAYGEDLESIVGLWSKSKDLPHYAALLSAIVRACAGEPLKTEAFHYRLTPVVKEIVDADLVLLIRALRDPKLDRLGRLVSAALRERKERVATFEKEILDIPEDLEPRTEVERVLLEQPGQLEKAVPRLVQSFKKGKSNYPASMFGRDFPMTDEIRMKLRLACIEGIESFPDGYIRKLNYEPHRATFITVPHPPPDEILPKIVLAYKALAAKKASKDAQRAALALVSENADKRVVKFLLAHWDEYADLKYEKPARNLAFVFEEIQRPLPKGDANTKEYWQKLYDQYATKLGKQLE